MEILEILIILFAIFALIASLFRLKSRSINLKQFIFWAILWVVLILLVLVRQSLGFLSQLSSGVSPFRIVVIFSIILLFYLMFEIYVKLDKMEQQTTKLVRNIAIQKAKKK